MEFFDANVTIGRPRNAQLFEPVPDADQLCARMHQAGIAKALVSHWGQSDGSPLSTNALVDEAVSASRSLFGCWAVLPPLTDPLVDGDFFNSMQAAGAVAVCMLPTSHRYVLAPVVWGSFLDELCARRVPVMFDMSSEVGWADLYSFLREVSSLTCVLRNIGTWSMDRYTYPLLDAYANVYLETSMLSIEDGGVEGVVQRFGAERLLFGTGFPVRYAEASMLQLIHADITGDQRRAIASGNLERLVAGAAYE